MLKVKFKSNVSRLIEELYAPENVDSAILWEISNKFPQALSEGAYDLKRGSGHGNKMKDHRSDAGILTLIQLQKKLYQSIIKVKIYRG